MKKIKLLVLNMVATLSLFAFSSGALAQLGSLNRDLVFTPVTPCRILDTRNPGSLSGVLAAGSTRNFLGSVLTSFAIQGGSENNCNVLESTDTAAIQVNFTVVNPNTGGYITAFPADTPAPLAATLNFSTGDVKGNNATLKLNQTAGQFHFKIFSSSQTHLVADVVGYYAKPKATALDCYTTTPNAAATATIDNFLTGRYHGFAVANSCSTGFVAYGTPICNTSSILVNLSKVDGTQLNGVCTANHSTNTETISASQRCCRTPGYDNSL